MAVPAPRTLKIGAIIDKTLGVAELNAANLAIFVAVLTALNSAVKYFTLEMPPTQQAVAGLLSFVIGIVASYLMLEAALRKTGLHSREGDAVFFAYLGLSIVSILGIILGLILVILPGLVIWARWSIAAPLLVARGGGAMKALGESWEQTRGNEFQILVALLALLLVPIVVIIACSVMFDPANPVGYTVSQLASSAASALALAMSVALYGLIEGARTAAGPAA